MTKKTKKPVNELKRIKTVNSAESEENSLTTDTQVDPIKIGRQSFASVVDQPVIFAKKDSLIRTVTEKLQEFIAQGEPLLFLDWLQSNVPDWFTRTDNARILHRVGVAHKFSGNFPEADKFYRAAVEKMEKEGDLLGASDALQELSLCALAISNDHSKAWWYLNRAVEICPRAVNSMAYYNRVALAACEGDDRLLKSTIRELMANVPLWYKEDQLLHLLETDVELDYLRRKPELWAPFREKLERR